MFSSIVTDHCLCVYEWIKAECDEGAGRKPKVRKAIKVDEHPRPTATSSDSRKASATGAEWELALLTFLAIVRHRSQWIPSSGYVRILKKMQEKISASIRPVGSGTRFRQCLRG
jgi:hypothetical protein